MSTSLLNGLQGQNFRCSYYEFSLTLRIKFACRCFTRLNAMQISTAEQMIESNKLNHEEKNFLSGFKEQD